ncbi:MAG: energy transducer TonB [Deltaproteobacteria bacterium]|jgi:protein TonB
MSMAKQASGAFSSGWHPGGDLPDQEWKRPLALAVGLHAAVLLLALASPVLFNRGPVLPEIQTVNLFDAVESVRPAPAAKPKTRKKAAPAVVKPKAHKIKKVAPPPKIAPAKTQAVSERPLPSKTAKDLAKLREIKRTLAVQKAQEAEKVAQKEVKDALASIRDLYHEEKVVNTPPAATESMPAAKPAPVAAGAATTSSAGTGGGKGAIVQEVLRRYLAAVHDRIQQHWTLPDLQSWDESLEAVMVIKVRKDGIVTGNFFEKRSDNFYFDQFVEKAVREASPLPPFPPDLNEDRLEIGLRFRPGEIL